MTDKEITVQDPRIISIDYEQNSVTFETPSGDRIQLDSGTIVRGVGEHYFEGTVDVIHGDNHHHRVTFTDVTLGDEQTDRHVLPFGELAKQIDENGLSIF
jgi:hypothetical protein